MKKRTGAFLESAMMVTPLMADLVEDTFVLNEELTLVTRTVAPAHVADVLEEVISGWHFRGKETRAMQADDFDNPGMIFVEQAQDSWATGEGTENKSCSSCRGASEDMAGVRPVYPKYNEDAGDVRTLEMQINDCRENQMGADNWKYTDGDMANKTALLASVSRGMSVNVAIDGPAQSTWEEGKELYCARTGQLELACASCHEANYGNMIRADHLSQGQINGFPTYRLKNTKLNCACAVQRVFAGYTR